MTEGPLRTAVTVELVVVRHGRTAWNDAGRFQGHSDVPLDETGRSQARALAAYLSRVAFSRAVSSDLARARETAEIILQGRDTALEMDARWREMRFGVWEGLTWPEIVERNPELANRPANVPRFYTPEGGESFDDLCARVRLALESLTAQATDGDTLLVATHAGPLHALLRVVLGESESASLRVKFLPATLTKFALGPTGARVTLLNHEVTESVA
jgi:broad specificity phosphatase PhoE